MTRIFALSVLGGILLAAGATLAAPLELPPDNRIKLLEYSATDIYTVTTRVGYQSSIEFDPHEEIETISVGDRSFWQIIPSGSRLFIRPLEANVATNMTIITTKRSYQFDLLSVAADADSGAKPRITYVAKFIYPELERPKPPSPIADPFYPPNLAQQPAYQPLPPPPPMPPPTTIVRELPPEPMPVPPPVELAPAPTESAAPLPPPVVETTPASEEATLYRSRNYLYSFSGSEAAAPHQVFDDGNRTYLKFQRPVPDTNILMLDKNGVEERLSFHREDGYYVVNVVARELVVRRNGKTARVYNELLGNIQ